MKMHFLQSNQNGVFFVIHIILLIHISTYLRTVYNNFVNVIRILIGVPSDHTLFYTRIK